MGKDFDIGYENIVLDNIFGYLGLVFGLLYRVPQMIKLYQTKRGDQISVPMLVIQNLSYVFYIAHGVIIGDFLWIFSSAISLIQGLAMQQLIRYYKGREELELPT